MEGGDTNQSLGRMRGSSRLRVLMIEDAEDEAELILVQLRRGGYEVHSERVDTAPALRAALRASQWDLITCDWVMPRLHPTEAFDLIRENGADVPVIIISGQVGEDVAVRALNVGAHHYINKHFLARLVPAVERELREARERASRREAEEDLRSLNVRLEDRIRHRTRQLEASVQSWETFAELFGHDLRAPLRSINGFSEVLFDEYGQLLDDRGRDYLARIQRAGAYMNRMLEGILELGRISHAEIRREAIDLSQVVREVVAEHARQEPGRQVTFAIQDAVSACGDRTLIETVVDNLVGNAFKFTRAKAHGARIEFGLVPHSTGGRTYFIRDNGIGFEANRSSEMFRAFRRLHDSAELEGDGIGLAIVHRIISGHGGAVWAEGDIEVGATFYFTLGPEDVASDPAG